MTVSGGGGSEWKGGGVDSKSGQVTVSGGGGSEWKGGGGGDSKAGRVGDSEWGR